MPVAARKIQGTDQINAIRRSRERDPKYAVVVNCLRERGWLDLGCIIFSQYRHSIQWLAEQLTAELPDEDEELDAMALNNYVGRVPEPAVKMLQLGVGQSGSNRTAVVRQAVATAQTAHA